MSISPKQLRIFVALAESLNFSKTAQALHLTQPTLSRIIKELETAMGTQLFERSTRYVKLAPAGATLLEHATRVVHQYDQGIESLLGRAAIQAQHVSVSALPSLASILLPKVTRDLQQTHPHARLTIHDGSAESALDRLLHRQVDFALASADPSQKVLAYEEILRDRFVVLAAGRLASVLPESLTLRELSMQPIITMTSASTTHKYMSSAFIAQDIQHRPHMILDQISTIGCFVREEIGVATLPYLGAMPLLHDPGIRLIEISDGPVRSIGVVTRHDSPLTPIAEHLLESVRHHAKRISSHAPKWLQPARRV